MKTRTANFIKSVCPYRLLWAGCTALLFVFGSCKKETQEVDPRTLNESWCGVTNNEKQYLDHAGTMLHLEELDCWGIRFKPDSQEYVNANTEFFAFITCFELPDSLKINGKDVKFTGFTVPNFTYTPDSSIFHTEFQFYNVYLKSIKPKE